jgi:site-specific recombinase XerD
VDNEIGSLLASWQRSLRARNLAPKTIKTYLEAAGQLVDHVTAAGVRDVAEIERHHIEEFIAEQVETRSAATASVRFRALQQFFGWCVDEEELEVNPMAKMRPPVVPERPVPVLSDDKARALLKACAGSGFVPRRDTAIVRLFLDTGMRLNELTKLRVDEVDLDDDVAIVTGKGRRPRTCPFGSRTAQALDRYLRARSRHPQANLPALWLGATGREAMTDNGIAQMIRKRGREAGIEGLHPHMLRHTFAHAWLAEGGNEGDLMRLAGWKNRQMLNRYGASAADQRARDAHRHHGLGDRL